MVWKKRFLKKSNCTVLSLNLHFVLCKRNLRWKPKISQIYFVQPLNLYCVPTGTNLPRISAEKFSKTQIIQLTGKVSFIKGLMYGLGFNLMGSFTAINGISQSFWRVDVWGRIWFDRIVYHFEILHRAWTS